MSAINATSHDTLPVNIVHGTHNDLVLFLVLNMWTSHFGLPLLVGVVLFSKTVKRHPTFVNLCVVFIIAGMLYAGRITGPEPSPILCLLQASLVYGTTSLTSTAALMLVLQMFFTIRAAYNGEEYYKVDHFFRTWILLSAPYVAYFVAVVATATVRDLPCTRPHPNVPPMLGWSHGSIPCLAKQALSLLFCRKSSIVGTPLFIRRKTHLEFDRTDTLTIYSAIILFATFVMMVWTMVLLYKRLLSMKALPVHLRSNARKLDLSFPLRILTFGFYIIIAMSLSLLSVTSPSTQAPDIVIASAPTFVILIFGSQRDVVNALCFWKCTPQQVPEAPTSVALQQVVDAKGEPTFNGAI
ncbi:hypothetical protein D9613_005428 [Agrocybe pediades]|uniref:Uncharacterized protein n=1 Tax=Agrocybe pediades TaxID=84607 RepID=A0A8H4VQV5_9AGAR|nr:hypothetical protein D9613_005428 [Agrocybe pediades]